MGGIVILLASFDMEGLHYQINRVFAIPFHPKIQILLYSTFVYEKLYTFLATLRLPLRVGQIALTHIHSSKGSSVILIFDIIETKGLIQL